MITREVREWLKKAECGMYSADDVLSELARFSPYLSREDLLFIKKRLQQSENVKLKYPF